MSPLKINFAEVKGLEPVDAGTYPIEVVAARETAVKGGGKYPAGTPMLNVRLRISSGDNEGRQIFHNFIWHEDELWRFKSFMAACGQDVGSDEDLEVDPEDMIGLSCLAEVTVSKGQLNKQTGEPYPDSNNVRKFTDMSGVDLDDLI